MAQTKYTYSIADDTANGLHAPDSLAKSIHDSAIVTALDYVSALGDVLDVYMKDSLSAGDETILDGVVSAHTGVPIEVEKIQKVQTYIGSNDIKLLEFGYSFVATKNSDTDGDLLLPVKYLRGCGVEAENHFFGDNVTVQIVDVDGNYYAAGTVIDTFGKNVQIPKSGLMTVISESISNALPTGLYFRVKYHSAGTENDVNVRVNCRGYNDID